MTNRKMFWAMIVGAVFRRRSRAIMAVIASMVGAMTLFCLAAISIAVPQQMNEELRSYGANLIVTATGGMSDETVSTIESTVTGVADAKAAAYRYESVRINSAPYVMAGIDVNEVRNLNRHWNVDGSWPSEGRVLVGRDVADALGVSIGSTVTIGYRGEDSGQPNGDVAGGAGASSGSAASGSSEDKAAGETGQQTRDGRVSTDILDTSGTKFQVAGIVDTGGSEDEIVYAVGSDLTTLAGKRGPDVIEFSSEASEDQLSGLVSKLNKQGAAASAGSTGSTGAADAVTYQAQQVTKMTASNQRIITMLKTLFWIVSLVVLVLTLVGVSTTMASIVSQRRNEIGLRKALGASSLSVAAEFFVESALYGLLGGLIGMGLGYALARVLCAQVFERTLDFSWALGVASVLLSVVLAIIASIPPVRRATRIDPAIVLREE
ncbi:MULTISPECIES: ABC transporter permease [Bifidobacterium]|uniref:ABC transporter permease n=2 Tax=Bifidobacterium TaxID=1678 RepID=A0A2M9HQM5_9BIFI|nr:MULTISPECIES: FtsX-like permease family protein [Bifidobacterium]PJM79098.1 ABC transporter permease [Bifidobacterium scaligerum]